MFFNDMKKYIEYMLWKLKKLKTLNKNDFESVDNMLSQDNILDYPPLMNKALIGLGYKGNEFSQLFL